MNATTKNMIEIAERLGRRGFTVAGVELRTPDGRVWSIDAATAGGFRLFEIDPDGRRGPEEHDAIDGDTWHASDLVDYLDAVGRPKAPPPSRTTHPTA
ncbi:MAG: hypothetical protein KF769_16130 [Parvibaculum sp.]|nr:hypothetical protein [Parvibaculum sp.]MCW5775981.1 hypothetical protein [Phycisphaeraceae bacterium]